jgi:hypothetical protein
MGQAARRVTAMAITSAAMTAAAADRLLRRFVFVRSGKAMLLSFGRRTFPGRASWSGSRPRWGHAGGERGVERSVGPQRLDITIGSRMGPGWGLGVAVGFW